MGTEKVVYLQLKRWPEKTLIPYQVTSHGLVDFDNVVKVEISDLQKKFCTGCGKAYYVDSRKANGENLGPREMKKCVDCLLDESINQEVITKFF